MEIETLETCVDFLCSIPIPGIEPYFGLFCGIAGVFFTVYKVFIKK